MPQPPNPWLLFEEARRYDEGGDPYFAIKLYKKVIRLAPDFADAYRALGRVYSRRKEWKPAFHYWKKALGLVADDREAWWHMGLASVPLKKMNLARSVWNKFGFGDLRLDQPLGLRVKHENNYEILWMQPLDAARCRILSIPHPGNGLHYRQTMLYDRRGWKGSSVINGRRIPIFDAIDSLKLSPYETFSCLLHTSDEKSVKQLEKMCFEAGLGFEVWSNATRAMSIERKNAFPEYYQDILPRTDNGTTLVAMAAIHPAEIERTLNDWQIISLGQYSDLRAYGK